VLISSHLATVKLTSSNSIMYMIRTTQTQTNKSFS